MPKSLGRPERARHLLHYCGPLLLLKSLALIVGLVEYTRAGYAQTPQRTLATYGDWTVSCSIASAGNKSCGLVQIARKDAATATLGIGNTANNRSLTFTVLICENVWLPTGLQLILNANGPTLSAPFKWCTARRCFANRDLSDADIKNLRIQKTQAKLVYKTASQTDVSIPISFSGFSDALDALQKE